ncbi:hypothetical protein BY458DRAFT_509377 [Sporodiniella umbellata]|nr:hypothetical protein BY458DRAFT_509377 [Sporodiniella umbellata]
MPRHSKNNTASSVFTYHEASKLEYGTKKQRLGRDSFRDYNACFLCLQIARDPVCCAEGHIACRECMYENILQQKENIQWEQKRAEQSLQEQNSKKETEEAEAKRMLLNEFDKTQNSMLGNRLRAKVESPKDEKLEKPTDKNTAGTKRKFELTQEEIKSIAERDIQRTSLQLKEEKEEAAKPKIGSFWLPSLTPVAENTVITPTKTQVKCHAISNAHPLTMKSLIDVKFQIEENDKSKNVCPACLKSLTNVSKLSIMRGCGHVICNTCIDMFVKKAKKCYVCEKKVKSKDIIDMTPEGTGFASSSTKAVAERYTLAFQ